MPDVVVSLKSNKISVDRPSVDASVSKGQQVTWTSTDGAFQIEYKTGSDWPNPPAARNVNGTWTTSSGPFNRPNTTLSYSVTADGYQPLDPDIQIIP